MSDQRSPARPWFDFVMERIAIRGWSLHELSRRSGVGRPTIYRWRDGAEVPQSRPVGLVADALGVPRERAVRLAGIIAAPSGTPAPVPPASSIPPTLLADIMAEAGLSESERQAVIAAVEETLARERGASGPSAPEGEPERRRPAS